MGVTTRPRLRHKLRAEIEASILDAAEQVALEDGTSGMTIAAVADRAGLAVGTLYNYFPNGDGILVGLFRQRRAKLVPMINAAARDTRGLPFERRLREVVRRLLVAYETQEKFLRIAVLIDRDGSKCKPRDTTVMDATVKALDEVMRQGAKQKRFPAERALINARMLHGALRSLFVWRVTEGGSFVSDGDLLVDTFLRGLEGA
jgi:AcrR family transcriptional regulator